MTPFETAIGPQFHHLSAQIRQLHGGRAPLWRGHVSVERSPKFLARIASALAGLPPTMDRAPFELRVNKTTSGECWDRNFAGSHTRSVVSNDSAGNIIERFGPIQLTLRALVKVDALKVDVTKGALFGIFPLPKRFLPKSNTKIWQDEAGRYRFDISASLPVTGPMIRYHGWLRPDMLSGFVDDERL